MTSIDVHTLRVRIQQSLRALVPTLIQVVDVGGLALLAAGAALPLITSGFSPATLVAMLGAAGGNALASWLQQWAEQRSGLAEPDVLPQLAADLEARLAQDTVLVADVEALLREVGALPLVLATLAQQDEDQGRLLQFLLEDGQRNAMRVERLLNYAIDDQRQSTAELRTLLESLRADLRAGRTKPTSVAIRIVDSPGTSIWNTGTIAGRDVNNYYYQPQPSFPPPDLNTALALLSKIPTDDAVSVPDPQPLDVPHRMTLRPNPAFVGRDDELRRLACILKDGQTCAVTTGIGGVGKTQLAVEFAHRFGRYFAGGVFWLSFADPATIEAQVAACGGSGALELFTDVAQLTQAEQTRRVRAAWNLALPRLLIFDNCEDPQLFRQWQPAGGCRVLLTSRTTTWAPTLGVVRMPLDVLPRAESVLLLRRYRSELAADNPTLDAICHELDDLPLALHLVGSVLAVYKDDPLFGDPVQLLADLQSGPILMRANELAQEVGDSPTQHDLNVARSFELSYKRLDGSNAVDAMARQLLARAALLAPGEAILRNLLLVTLRLPAGDTAAQRQAARALVRLTGLGLLQTGGEDTLRLHRLLRAFVQAEGLDASALEAVEQGTVDILDPRDNSYVDAVTARLLPHLRFLADNAFARTDDRAARLCNMVGIRALWDFP